MAHGLAAWRQHRDLNASFSRAWSPASGWSTAGRGGVKPPSQAAVDVASEATDLRLLPVEDLLVVRLGSAGSRRPVLRRAAGFGRAASVDKPAAVYPAAPPEDPLSVLSADAMCLLLLGPLALLDRASTVNWGPPDTLDERRCDQLVLTVTPGLGLAPESRMALFIDREAGWLRRLRWAGDGGDTSWRGLAEVDFFDHLSLQGMVWPRRFQSPPRWWLPGAAPQTGRLTGLDLDRGYGAEALTGERWTGAAAAPARPLPQD